MSRHAPTGQKKTLSFYLCCSRLQQDGLRIELDRALQRLRDDDNGKDKEDIADLLSEIIEQLK